MAADAGQDTKLTTKGTQAVKNSMLIVSLLTQAVIGQGWVDVTGSTPGPVDLWIGAVPYLGYFAPVRSAAAFDEARSRVVALGFRFSQTVPSSFDYETWEYDGMTWTARPGPTLATTGIGTRTQLFYDTRIGRVAFVERTPTGLAELSWDGVSWTAGSTGTVSSSWWYSGDVPMSAFDRARGKVVIVAPSPTGETAEFDVTTGACTILNPAVRAGGAGFMFYDYQTGRVAMLASTAYYEWSGINWVQRFPSYPWNPGTPSRPAECPVGGALVMDYAQSPVSPSSVLPRTMQVGRGSMRELFLNNYPSVRNDPIVYDTTRGVFVLVGALGDTWELNIGPAAGYSSFGAGCTGSRGVPALAPQPGSTPRISTNFVLQALNLPITGPVFLFLGSSDTVYGSTPLPLNLGPNGAPTCNLLVGVDVLFGAPNVLGSAFWSFPVPPLPGSPFYVQAVVFDPPANALGVTLSNAGRGVIGN